MRSALALFAGERCSVMCGDAMCGACRQYLSLDCLEFILHGQIL